MKLDVKFSESVRMNVKFSESIQQFNATFGEISEVTVDPDVEHYIGDYEITPATKAQTIETANKMMNEDMIVKAIPYAEVTNISNGKTVTIG